VIREDRELLVELARLNRNMASLAMRIIEGSASSAEQAHYARRLIVTGERLQRRAKEANEAVIEGNALTEDPLTLPAHPIGLCLEP
jgi:hypothetical protein